MILFIYVHVFWMSRLAGFTGSSAFQENCLNSDVVEQIYKRNPILRHTHHPLHSPLLPLPYGDINLNRESPAPPAPRCSRYRNCSPRSPTLPLCPASICRLW